MYKKIDEFYKKNSFYKKIKIFIFVLSFIVSILLSAFSTIENYIIPFIVIFGLSVLVIKSKYEKILGEKLYFNFSNKNNNNVPLDDLINEKEKNMIVQYLKKYNLYDKDAIKCIMEHYRFFIKNKVVNGNFFAILSIIVTIALTFVTKEGFDTVSFENSIPYLLSVVMIFILVYFPISKVIALKKFIMGEDGLEERLESIFSELYIEFDRNSILEVKKEIVIQKKGKGNSFVKTCINIIKKLKG